MSNRFYFNRYEQLLEDRVAPSNTPPVLLGDVVAGTGTSDPRQFTAVNNTLFYSSGTPATGAELWASDGTPASTRLVRDNNPGPGSGIGTYPVKVRYLENIRGTLYFAGSDGTTGNSVFGDQLFVSDGTSAGTRLVKTFDGPLYWAPFGISDLGSVAVFGTGKSGSSATQFSLWRSDGTSAGTTLLREFYTLGVNNGTMTPMDGKLYFNGVALGVGGGGGLWVTDGSVAGTRLLRSLSSVASLTEVGGKMFFTAYESGSRNELYVSDGTSAGTHLVRDITQTIYDNVYVTQLTNLNGRLLFSTYTPETGYELWSSDGTSNGTVMVRDINPGTASSGLTGMIAAGNNVYFTANDGSGAALWASDGTSVGTHKVHNVQMSSGTWAPSASVGGILYFAGTSGTSNELWRSDGTAIGTTMIDLEANSSAAPDPLKAVGNRLYFTANKAATGRELFTLEEDNPLPTLTAITANTSGVVTAGQTVTFTLSFSEPVTLTGSMTLTLNTGGTVTVDPFSGTSTTVVYTAGNETTPRLRFTGLSLPAGSTLRDATNQDAIRAVPNTAFNLVINPLPPTTISLVTINAGVSQRSQLTTLKLNFATPVNAALLTGAGAITLTRTSGGPTTVVQTGATGANGLITIAPATGMVSAVTLTFSNADFTAITAGVDHGSLTDGRWQLSIPYLQYVSPLNDVNLGRLFGDANGDATIDGADLVLFGNTFSSNNPVFDFNYDGTVDGSDLVTFGNRFGLAN